MHVRAVPAVAVVLAVVLYSALLLSGAALAAKTVSTSDGMTLTLTDSGAFSSLTVNGNTAPTLGGVNGGFYIVPMDGVAMDLYRTTFYPGTQITGTATQNGANVTISATVQNQTFSITLTGGLPYIKVDGTVTGNGTDHAFLVDFRLPVDANGWSWGNRVNQPQTINTGTSNWYFASGITHWGLHPYLSVNPYGSITRYGSGSGSADMGISLAPLFYPPAAYAIEYNGQGGFWIDFELGTTSKTTKHPNTADFHFVLYQNSPKWGNRSTVQRYQSFFPTWFNRTVSGGNWYVSPSPKSNLPPTPSDFRFKFCEGGGYDDSYAQQWGLITCVYTEPWCWHVWSEDPSMVWPETYDTTTNFTKTNCHCPGNRGLTNGETAQADFNSVAWLPDGTLHGPDRPDLWTDYNGSSWRWIMNPDPEIPNWQGFTPGTTRSGNDEFREWYWAWGTAPGPTDKYTGLYHDSAGGYWGGWDVVHNFNPNHWPYFDYSPGIYWGSQGNGLVTMWAPFSNVEWMKYSYEQMRKENRTVYANSGASIEAAMTQPFLDAWGTESSIANTPITDQALMRAVAGGKPLSFLDSWQDANGGNHPARTGEMLQTLPFAIYPGGGWPNSTNPTLEQEYEDCRSTYQSFMPIFDTLDAAQWNPITAASAADSTQILERFGPDSSGAIYYVLRAVNAGTGTVTVYYADLGWASNPNVTVTSLYGAAPSTSYSSGNLVLSFGSISASDDRVVKLVYNGTPTVPVAAFTANNTSVAVNTAVTFTDQSTHSPTAWYWDFGDGNVSLTQSPSHTYTAGGKCIVSLTASNASGQSTCTKDRYITVTAAPVANFAFYRVNGVIGAETTAEFRDHSTNTPTSWSWNFGDGNTSTAQNPTHTYTAAGTYNVSLTATNASGSSSPYTKTGLVVIVPIKANFSASPRFGTPGLVVNFTDQSAGTPTSWTWHFGDGNTSTAQNPSHTYNSANYYSPSLTVQNASGQDTVTQTNSIAVCTDVIVYPDSYTPANYTTYVSGSLTDLQADDSNYMVFKTANGSNLFMAQFFATTAYTPSQVYGIGYDMKVHASPTQSFSGNLSIYDPNASGWAWDSASGGGLLTTTDQWITRQGTAGAPKMSASGQVGCALCGCRNTSGYPTGDFNGYFNVVRFHIYLKPGGGPQPPVANFSGNPTTGTVPLTVAFTDTSTNTPTSWSWTFGDSSTSTVQNPSHQYTSTGSFTVALTATNQYGNNTNTKTNYITVNPAGNPPVANFSGTPMIGAAPLAVTFTDNSTNTPTSWSWTFGDSATSTVQNPSHTYAAGTYTVTLTATNAYGSDGETKTNYITAGNPPVANFSGTPTTGTAPLAVTFTDSSTNSPTTWSWNFGDSTTSAVQNPSHSYAAGTFTVTLTATNAYGSDGETKTNYITATSGGGGSVYVYPDTWGSTNGSTLVSGGQSELQADDDAYQVVQCNTSSHQYVWWYSADTAYTPSQLTKLTVDFIAKSSVSGTPGGSSIVWIRKADGSYEILSGWTCGTTENSYTWNTTSISNYMTSDGIVGFRFCGCPVGTSNYNISTDLMRFKFDLVGTPPVANFSGTPTTGAAPLAVTFTDTSTNSPTAWSWTFGDSNTSTVQNPSHTYAAGTYTVALTATNASGSDGETKTNYITAGNAPVANFSGTPTIGAAPLAVSFTDTSTNSPTAWSWTFGDSNTSTVQNPSHTYSSTGSFTVALTATNAYGNNTNTKNNYITVGNAPVANFSGTPTLGAAPLAVTFTDSSTNTPTAWSWTFGDSSTSTAQSPSHTYAAGTYTVSLTATNAFGSDGETKTNYITAGSAPVANFSGTPTTGNAPLPVTFTDSSTNSPTAWSWTFGDSSTSTAQNPSHTYNAAGNYTVALTATNAYGNNTNTKNNYITVTSGGGGTAYAYPNTWAPGWSKNVTLISGGLSDLQAQDSAYMVIQCDTSNHIYSVVMTASTGYTPSQVSKITLDYVAKSSISPTGGSPIFIRKSDGSNELLGTGFSPGQTDSTYSWNSTSVSTYLGSDGIVGFSYCGCPTAGDFTISSNMVRWTLDLVGGSPPVANFSGTPTTGTAPLAVTFTDSSTNSPTAWSWDFGDSTTSTVQNPSHTYAAGTYTVTLTATNASGSDGETKTNYIMVAAAAPTFVAAGAVSSGTGAITPALPAGIATNDVLLLFLETSNQAISISNQNGGTWTAVTGSPQGTGSGASSNATRLTAYWSRYNGTQGAPTTSDSGDHQLGRIIAIRGAATSGNPWDVTAGGVESAADTSGSIPGATTTVANTLVVAAIATALPDASGTANFSAWTNANLTNVTERTDNTVTAGNGGGLGIATGGKATAGAYGNTAVTCASSTRKGMMSIAIKP